ncbi:recombination-associated protein RdgC [Vibrio sp. S4M6]|uniref:recombination-associated protein RdgC n=1 Tax=Vibrio sinus TaxID=2946865 RepID=UPI002029FCFB|nr:recombination-associated protein RdgC [Vibrio sinus]MCL9783642.1 recombination-associated protein RdgC [Vibrio sinus]
MFPKNCMVYRFSREFVFDLEKLEAQLQEFQYRPCSELDQQKVGWTRPLGKFGEKLVHVVGRNLLITAKKEEKMMPASVVNRELSDRIEKREGEEGRPLKKREKDAIKDSIVSDFLPKAFSRFSEINVFINTKNQLLIVDCSSAKTAESILALLRKSIGSLPVVPAIPEMPIEIALTQWVKHCDLPLGFHLGDNLKLKSLAEAGDCATFKYYDLSSDEVQTCIENNMAVCSAQMDWQNRIVFNFSDDGAIKGLKFSDDLRYQNDDIPREDEVAKLDADFCLISGELESFLDQLYLALGGFPELEPKLASQVSI